jgi:iron-sulfur cluster assembly accessory protein
MSTTTTTAVATVQPASLTEFAMRPADLLRQAALIQEVMHSVMKDGEHFGVIPGTEKKDRDGNLLPPDRQKRSLFKSGAEKLCFVFGLAPKLEIIKEDLPRDRKTYLFLDEVQKLEIEAIRRAIAECHRAGGGRVLVTGGVFLTGAIHLESHVELHVADGATLKFDPDPAKYLPVVQTRFEGTELMNYSPLVYAFEKENIAITGGGCNGLSYKMRFVGEAKPADILVRTEGVEVLVDPKSALYLRGTQLDYSDKMIGGGFKFSNPNAKASRSCGESFSL